MGKITLQIIKENITTINNGNYRRLESRLGVTKKEIDDYIEQNIFDKLPETTVKDIKKNFYDNGSKCTDSTYGTKALANTYLILEDQVKELLIPKTNEEWEYFLSITISAINKRKKNFYAGRTFRIPEQKETLQYLYQKYEKLTEDLRQEIKSKFDIKGRNYDAIMQIANEYKLYYEDVTEIVEDISDDEWETFLGKNIQVINETDPGDDEGINKFKYTIPNSKQIEERLGAKLLKENEFSELINKISKNEEIDFVEVANKKRLYYKQLERAIRYKMYLSVFDKVDKTSFKDTLSKSIFANATQGEINFLHKEVSEFNEKLITFVGMQGFRTNMLNINSGVMTANAGDAAQFLFLARAIMIGFNCSNVDVRSSRYDAVIDYEGVLLKIQIKGISDEVVKFRDRDRGGNGVDHNNLSNIGKYISAEDCDLYVAVDKQCGICYIIPVEEYIEPLDRATKKNGIKLSELSLYKENWDTIISLAQKKNKR